MSVHGVFICALTALLVFGCVGFIPPDAAAQIQFHTETVDSVGDVGWQTSIAIDRFGFPNIGYIRYFPSSSRNDVLYARGSAAGWSVDTASTAANPYSATSLVLDSNDNPAMVTGSNAALYVFKDASGWTVEEIGGFATWFATMDLDNNGVPRVLYNWSVYKEPYSRVAYATRIGTDTWSEVTIGSGPFTPISPDYSLVIDGNDDRHAACISTNGDTLEYWFTSGTVSMYEKFTPASNCDMAVNDLNEPRIVYYDADQADLILLARDGLTWAPTTVDQSGDVGRYCSLALGEDGSCHIAYYDADNGDLKYARRSSPAQPWDTQVVDDAGDVGQWTSIALDGEGRPHIAYYDVSKRDLRYAGLSPLVPVEKTTWGALKTLMEKR